MSIDPNWISEPNEIDEEFAYIMPKPARQNIHFSPQHQTSQEDSYMNMKSSNDTKQREDPFGEPVYIRPLQPKPCQLAKTDAKIHNETVTKNALPIPLKGVRKMNRRFFKVTTRSRNKSEEVLNPQCDDSFQSESSDSEPARVTKSSKSKKVKKPKREQYPTKNFLPSFRSSFLNYIGKHFSQAQFNSFSIVKRIKGKPCINLQDYEDLFKQPQFQGILLKYFKDQVIVRDLMQSRIEYSTKCYYFTRIYVFERAFQKKEFTKINY